MEQRGQVHQYLEPIRRPGSPPSILPTVSHLALRNAMVDDIGQIIRASRYLAKEILKEQPGAWVIRVYLLANHWTAGRPLLQTQPLGRCRAVSDARAPVIFRDEGRGQDRLKSFGAIRLDLSPMSEWRQPHRSIDMQQDICIFDKSWKMPSGPIRATTLTMENGSSSATTRGLPLEVVPIRFLPPAK